MKFIRTFTSATAALAVAGLAFSAIPVQAATTAEASKLQLVDRPPSERIVPIKPPRDLCPRPVPPPGWAVPLYCDIVLPPELPGIPKPVQPPLKPAATQASIGAERWEDPGMPVPWPEPWKKLLPVSAPAVGQIQAVALQVPTRVHPSPFPGPQMPSPWPEPWPSPWPGPTNPIPGPWTQLA